MAASDAEIPTRVGSAGKDDDRRSAPAEGAAAGVALDEGAGSNATAGNDRPAGVEEDEVRRAMAARNGAMDERIAEGVARQRDLEERLEAARREFDEVLRERDGLRGELLGLLQAELAARATELAEERAAAEERYSQLETQAAREAAAAESRLSDLQTALHGAQDREAVMAEQRALMAARSEELGTQLAQTAARQRDLEQRMEAVRREVEQVAGERDGLRAELVALRREMEDAELRLRQTGADLEREREALEHVRAAEAQAVAVSAKLDTELRDVRSVAEKAHAQVAELTAALESRDQELKSAVERIGEVERQNAAVAEERAQLREEGQRQTGLLAEWESRFAELGAERDRVGVALDETERKRVELEDRLRAEKESHETALRELSERTAAVEAAQACNQELTAQLRELERQAQRMSETEAQQRGCAEEYLRQLQANTESLAVQTKRTLAAENLCAQIQAQAAREMAEAEERVAALEASLAAAQAQEIDAAEESRRLAARCEALGEQLNQRAARALQLEERVEELRSRHSEVQSDRDAARVQLIALQEQHEGAKLALTQVRADLDSEREARGRASEEQTSLLQRCESLESELERMRVAAADADARARALRTELDGRGADLKEAVGRIEAAEEQLARLEEERVQMKGERDEVEALLTEREQLLSKVTAESDRLRSQLEEAARQRSELERRVATFEGEREAALQELAERISMAEVAEAREARLYARITELDAALRAGSESEAQLRELAEDRKRQMESAEARANEAENTYQQFAEELTLLRVELSQQKREADSLRVALEKEISQRADRPAGAAAAKGEIAALKRNLAETQTRNEALAGQIEGFQRARAADQANLQRAAEQVEKLQGRVSALDSSVAVAREQESALRGTVGQLQDFLLQEQSRAASLRAQVENQTAARQALESALTEVRERAATLERTLEAEREEAATKAAQAAERIRRLEVDLARIKKLVEEQEAGSKEEISRVRSKVGTLEERLVATDSERQELQVQVETLEALKVRLDAECEQLRRRVPSTAEIERQRAEAGRLQARLAEVERQQSEAVQRHSAAVSGYMHELNQRTELLRQRDTEIEKLTEQVSLLQQARDDAVSEVSAVREERELLELRVRELESARTVRLRQEQATIEEASQAASVTLMTGAPEPLGFEAGDEGPATAAEAVGPLGAQEPRAVVHLEDDVTLQTAVREGTAKFPDVRYITLQEALQNPPGRVVLAINLLARSSEPLAAFREPRSLDIEEPWAFLYCAEGGRGICMGMVDLFLAPFEPDSCATRLLERAGQLQRLLAVSEDVESMNSLREILSKVRCSTSVAFDGRQALDLVPMVKPNVVLVDMALPRGDALRVIARLRADTKHADLSLALLWGQVIDWTDFRMQALRIVRDFPFAKEDLTRGIVRVLGSPAISAERRPPVRKVG
jgi:golgin subfamily B member 1